MAIVQSHRDLIVWQKAMDLAEVVYGLTAKFPHAEMCRLGSQTTRAVASVPANIAEGNARGTKRGLRQLPVGSKGLFD
jgi:four helix bundle protein